MSKLIQLFCLTVAVLVALSIPAFAAEGGIEFSASIGAAITIIGAGYGIGKIGSAAVDSMARQPEVAGQIQTAMLIAAALIEGVTLFALIVCIINNAGTPAG
ncbi:MAG: ATP synthase F0 subunit C [Planctomycetaceae bacterium]|nr:ATP synthase F0 subunit C [Planctomycetaceae bacterium]